MDKYYTDLAGKLSKSNQVGHCGRTYTSLINSTMYRFAVFLDEKHLDFSQERFSSWLIEQVPFPTEDQFHDVACLMDRIVANVNDDLFLSPSFCHSKIPSSNLLPQWGLQLLAEYCFYLLLTGKYQPEKRMNSLSFILFLMENGLENGLMVDCRVTSAYYLCCKKSIIGTREFIEFLQSIGMASYYAIKAYNPYFAARINIFDTVSFEDYEDEFTIEEYIDASEKLIRARKEAGYSISALQDTTIALNEFGIFLELHDKGFSMDAVKAFITVEEQKVGIKSHTRKRALNEMNEILCGKDLRSFSRIYYPSSASIPSWAKDSFNAYREMRIKNRMTQSTLNMDYSSLSKFCAYLDGIGITSFGDVTRQHIKDFNLQDKHSTAEGKAAYNHRIKAFLRFLYEEKVIEHNLSLSVPAVPAVKVKPPIILTEEEETKLNDYLDTTTSLLDKALLKIASQTGMRSIDIVSLTFDSIDWENRVFKIVQKKTKVETNLPFTNGVGNTLYEYITQERPRVESSFIFITPKAPFLPYTRNVVTSALGRALGKSKGAHILRKTLASKMTASSLIFSTVTDALGHTTDATLDPYISIDERRLKECALPLGGAFAYKGGLM